MARRPLALASFVLAAACSAPPAVTAPDRPAATTQARTPAPPAAKGSSAPSSEPDEGPPPDPPLAMRWIVELPSVAGQPGMTERLAVAESGDATWEQTKGTGDGDVDEELSPIAPAAAPRAKRCKGHLGPRNHRRIVLATLRAMAAGCARTGTVDRLGHPVDEATTRVAVTSAGKVESCELGRSGGSYAALERLRAEVVGTICAGR